MKGCISWLTEMLKNAAFGYLHNEAEVNFHCENLIKKQITGWRKGFVLFKLSSFIKQMYLAAEVAHVTLVKSHGDSLLFYLTKQP